MSKTDGRLANWYFLVGLALTVASVASPASVGGPVYVIATLQIVPIMIISSRLNEISRGLVASVSAIGAWYALTETVAGIFGTTGGARLATNIMDMIGSFLIVVVLTMLVRRRRNLNAAAVIGDALIVGLGSWLMSWVAFLQPTLAFSKEPLISSLIQGLYQPTGSVILFLMAVYLFTETGRNASSLYVGGAVLSVLLGDLFYSLVGAGHIDASILETSDAFYTLGYFCIAAAFLHPSIKSLDSNDSVGDSQRLLGRLIITTSSLIFPVIVLASSGPKDTADQIVRSI